MGKMVLGDVAPSATSEGLGLASSGSGWPVRRAAWAAHSLLIEELNQSR